MKRISKNKVKQILGIGFDDEGLITIDINDINKITKFIIKEFKK